jgi:hypothetical protein
MLKTNLVTLLLPLLAFGLTAAEPADNTLTHEQKAALAAVDVRLAGVMALAAKIDDPNYKAEVARQIEDLKKRRLAFEKNFDPGLYEVLMHSVISRYQVIALWLKPAPLPAPPPRPRGDRESRDRQEPRSVRQRQTDLPAVVVGPESPGIPAVSPPRVQ